MSEGASSPERYRFYDARYTSIAADLAEHLLEELSRRDHDWKHMEDYASRLATLTARMVALQVAAGGSAASPRAEEE